MTKLAPADDVFAQDLQDLESLKEAMLRKHNFDEEAATKEFCDLVEQDDRLSRAACSFFVDAHWHLLDGTALS